jgi:hypothetical protein
MNSIYFKTIFRFILLVLLQVFLLKHIYLGEGFLRSFYFIVYPLFILLLPFNTPRPALLLLGFFMGVIVDYNYMSLGVHASAAVLMAFLREPILRLLEPKGGYNLNFSPTKARMGWAWFTRYASIMMLIHLLFYFSMDIFTPYYVGQILQRTMASFVVSVGLIFILQAIFNPRE